MAKGNILVNGKNNITARADRLANVQSNIANNTTATNVNTTPNLPIRQTTNRNLRKAQQPVQTRLDNLNLQTGVGNVQGVQPRTINVALNTQSPTQGVITSNNPAFVNGQLINQNNSRFIGFQQQPTIPNATLDKLESEKQGKAWAKQLNGDYLTISSAVENAEFSNRKEEARYKKQVEALDALQASIYKYKRILTEEEINEKFPELKDNMEATMELQNELKPIIDQGMGVDPEQIGEYYEELLQPKSLKDIDKVKKETEADNERLNTVENNVDRVLKTNIDGLSSEGVKYIKDWNALIRAKNYAKKEGVLGGANDYEILQYMIENNPKLKEIYNEVSDLKLSGQDLAILSDQKGGWDFVFDKFKKGESEIPLYSDEDLDLAIKAKSKLEDDTRGESKRNFLVMKDNATDKLSNFIYRMQKDADLWKSNNGDFNEYYKKAEQYQKEIEEFNKMTDKEVQDRIESKLDPDIKAYYDKHGLTNTLLNNDIRGFVYKSVGDIGTNWTMPFVIGLSTVQPEIGFALMATDTYARENEEAYEELRKAGASHDEAEQGAEIVGLESTLVELGLEKILGGVETTASKAFRDAFMKDFSKKATEMVVNKGLTEIISQGMITQAKSSLEEGLEEVLQQVIHNKELQKYDPDQKLTEGLREAFEGGALNPMNLLAGGGDIYSNISQNSDYLKQESYETAYNMGKKTRDVVDRTKNVLNKTKKITDRIEIAPGKIGDTFDSMMNKVTAQGGEYNTQGQQQGQEVNTTSKNDNNINGDNYTQKNKNNKTLNKIQLNTLKSYNRMNPTKITEFQDKFGVDYGQALADMGYTESRETNVPKMDEDIKEIYNEKKKAMNSVEGEFQDESLAKMLEIMVQKAENTWNREMLKKYQALQEKHNERGLTMAEANDMREEFSYKIKTKWNTENNSDKIDLADNVYTAVREFLEKKAEENGIKDLRKMNRDIAMRKYLSTWIGDKAERQSANNIMSINDWIMLAEVAVNPKALTLFAGKKIMEQTPVKNAVLNAVVGRRENRTIDQQNRQATNKERMDNIESANRGKELQQELTPSNILALPNGIKLTKVTEIDNRKPKNKVTKKNNNKKSDSSSSDDTTTPSGGTPTGGTPTTDNGTSGGTPTDTYNNELAKGKRASENKPRSSLSEDNITKKKVTKKKSTKSVDKKGTNEYNTEDKGGPLQTLVSSQKGDEATRTTSFFTTKKNDKGKAVLVRTKNGEEQIIESRAKNKDMFTNEEEFDFNNGWNGYLEGLNNVIYGDKDVDTIGKVDIRGEEKEIVIDDNSFLHVFDKHGQFNKKNLIATINDPDYKIIDVKTLDKQGAKPGEKAEYKPVKDKINLIKELPNKKGFLIVGANYNAKKGYYVATHFEVVYKKGNELSEYISKGTPLDEKTRKYIEANPYIEEKPLNKVTGGKNAVTSPKQENNQTKPVEKSDLREKKSAPKIDEQARERGLAKPDGVLLYTNSEFKYIPSVKEGLIRLTKEEGKAKFEEQMKSALENGFTFTILSDINSGETYVYNPYMSEVDEYRDNKDMDSIWEQEFNKENIDSFEIKDGDIWLNRKERDGKTRTEQIDLKDFLNNSYLSDYVSESSTENKGTKTSKNKITDTKQTQTDTFEEIDPETLRILIDKGDKAAITLYEDMTAEDQALIDMYDNLKNTNSDEFIENLTRNETPQNYEGFNDEIEENEILRNNETPQRDEEGQTNKKSSNSDYESRIIKDNYNYKFEDLKDSDIETILSKEGFEKYTFEEDGEKGVGYAGYINGKAVDIVLDKEANKIFIHVGDELTRSDNDESINVLSDGSDPIDLVTTYDNETFKDGLSRALGVKYNPLGEPKSYRYVKNNGIFEIYDKSDSDKILYAVRLGDKLLGDDGSVYDTSEYKKSGVKDRVHYFDDVPVQDLYNGKTIIGISRGNKYTDTKAQGTVLKDMDSFQELEWILNDKDNVLVGEIGGTPVKVSALNLNYSLIKPENVNKSGDNMDKVKTYKLQVGDKSSNTYFYDTFAELKSALNKVHEGEDLTKTTTEVTGEKNAVTAKKVEENKPKNLVTSEQQSEFEILPDDVTVSQEAKQLGAKRIAPDRVPRQQLTFDEGVNKIAENLETLAEYKKARDEIYSPEGYNDGEVYIRYNNLKKEFQNIMYGNNGFQFKSNKSKEFTDLWKNIVDNKDNKTALREVAKNFYISKVKKDISKGYVYPQEVLDKIPGAKKAIDNREKYEKGLNTSFSAKDERIDYSEKDKIGAGMKSQDGKQITKEQKEDIVKGILDFGKTFGLDMKKFAEDRGLVYVHLHGGLAFLNNMAAGLYRESTNEQGEKNISVSVGGAENVRYKDKKTGERKTDTLNTTMSHELGHAMDYLVDNKLFNWTQKSILGSKYNPVNRLKKYYAKGNEIVARAIEQYVAVENGQPNYYLENGNLDAGELKGTDLEYALKEVGSYYDRPGYWSKPDYEKYVKPYVEEAFKNNFEEYKVSKKNVLSNDKNKITTNAERVSRPSIVMRLDENGNPLRNSKNKVTTKKYAEAIRNPIIKKEVKGNKSTNENEIREQERLRKRKEDLDNDLTKKANDIRVLGKKLGYKFSNKTHTDPVKIALQALTDTNWQLPKGTNKTLTPKVNKRIKLEPF